MEVHCALDCQDGVAQGAVALAATFGSDGRRLCNDQPPFLQFHNVHPHGIDAHADSGPVAGPALIGLAVFPLLLTRRYE